MAKDKTINPDPESVDADTDDQAAPATADLDAITESLASASPSPNESAILAAAQKASDLRAQYADLRDSKGNRFDPEIHVTDDDGAPKTTIGGKLRLRPGRKSSASKPTKGIGANSTGDSLTASQKFQARQTGEAAAGALITLGVVIGGDEWRPQVDESRGLNEREHLSHAFGDYFEAKGMTDIPPGVALTIAISAYALPRFAMPKTQTRMQRFKEWIATKIAQRRVRKQNNGAQSDPRDDGKRKDNASETTSRESEK